MAERLGFGLQAMYERLLELEAKLEVELTESVKVDFRDTYAWIVEGSPIWSGYYASNHRIMLRDESGSPKAGGDQAKLAPAIKPDRPPRSIYEGNIPTAVAEELPRLDQFALGDVITITTRVPYADDVERKHDVYASANALHGSR